MNIPEFIRWLVTERADGVGIDGGDLQEQMIEHGLLIERPATEDDCKTDVGLDYGLRPGDTWIETSPDLVAMLGQAEDA